MCLAHANKMNMGYLTLCLSTITVTTVPFIATTKTHWEKDKLYLVYVVALFDWLTQIRLFFKDKSVSLCKNCAGAAGIKEEFIRRSLQKGWKPHRPPCQSLFV